MGDEAEAIGALATAALAARAIEPIASGAGQHASHLGDCANCGARLHGAYCHACGQRGHIHRSLVHMGEEVVHGVIHFDGKIWRTLPLLVFRPGKLTRDYIHGRRACFVSPMGLFLFTVFLMFLAVSFAPTGGVETLVEQPSDPAAAAADRAAVIADVRARAARARAAAAADPGSVAAAEISAAWERALAEATTGDKLARVVGGAKVTREFDFNTGWPALDKKIDEYAKNPEFFFYKIKNTAYKFSFLMVPLSLPFIWLLFFWKRGVTMYDHAVFALYSLSFMSLLFTFASVLGQAPRLSAVALSLVLLAPPIHMFAQLKGAYGLTAFGALWRTVVLQFFIVIISTLFVVAILALGVSG